MYRLYHLVFLIELNIILFFFWIYALVFKNSYDNRSNKNKILALPYYPLNYAGGHSRIGDWKPYFEKEGITYDVRWASNKNEFIGELISESWLLRYWFYHKVLFRRFKLLFIINKYESVWIQRAFIPFYPFKDAYFEKIIRRINNNIVLDFYDADYMSNYDLTINGAKFANKVSVASLFLVDYFKAKGINTQFIRYAMNYEEYLTHSEKQSNKVIIGWLGAPDNFSNVKLIEDLLVEIEEKYSFVEFHFICREIKPIKLKRWKLSKWGDEDFDYHKIIADFDIGIAPMLNATDRDKARTAYKTLEYMAAALPFVTSPWGVSDKLVHNKNCLFANEQPDWKEKLELLIKDASLRKSLGQNARATLIEFHSYANVFEELNKVLLT